MKITQEGPLSWLVESETEEGVVHQVSFYKGIDGRPMVSCTCRDFECRKLPHLLRGAYYRSCTCKHINEVVNNIKWQAVEAMITLFDEGSSQ